MQATAVMLVSALQAGLIGDACAQADEGIVGYVKGRILVKPRPGLPAAALDKELQAHKGKRSGLISQIGVHIVELPENADAPGIAKALSKNPKFKFAELDLVVRPTATTNDPALGSAWHLAKTGAPTAWDTSAGTGIVIAVLDTGVDSAHPDLASNIVPGWNVYDNNSLTADVYGHGTAVAGTAAAVGNNLAGSAGVAWQSKIMPVRISGTDGLATYSAMASGITWAADRGAKVANLSYQTVAGSATVSSAGAYLRSKGGVLVVCAGNSATQLSYPLDTNIVAVSATTTADTLASFSSFGSFVDIAAPGAGIYTTNRGGGYGSWNGTSFASPVVAGVYALMMAANPRLSPANLDQALFSTAVDLGTAGADTSFGAGRVDAARAVSAARQMVATDATAPTVAIANPNAGATLSGTIPVDVSASDASGVTSVELYVNNALVASDTSGPYQFSLDTTALADGTVNLVAKAKDAFGNTGTSSVSAKIANDTVAPQVTITSPAGGAVVGSTVSVSASATDNRQVTKMSLLADGKEIAVSYGSTLSHSWTVAAPTGNRKRKSTATASTLTVRAWDAAGNQGSASVTVTIQ